MRMLPLGLLLLAACGSTRLYEGPELPPDQVVQLDEWSGIWDSRQTDLIELDGKPVDHDMVSGDWEITPGPHTIVAQAKDPLPLFGPEVRGDLCTLQFTGEPGVTYEIRTDWSDTHPPLNISIVDTRTDAVVVDNEPDSAADCLSADVDWGGASFVPSEYHTNAWRSVVVLVPEGRTIHDTDEWVELQCHYGKADPPDVDEIIQGLGHSWQDAADAPNMTVLAREEGASPSLLFAFYGTDPDDRLTSALVLLRTSGNRVHALMWFKVTPSFDEAELATWRQRFEQ